MAFGGVVRFDLSLFHPKARPVMGLDISSSAVKLVELAGTGKEDCRVDRHTVEMLPRDAVINGNIVNLEGVVDCVRRAWKKMATSTRNVAMALPSSAVITKKLIVPAGLREDELEIQVETEASQYIPFAIDEVNLDYQVLGPVSSSPGELEVLIAASKKEQVVDRVAVAEAAGLKAVVMDIDAFASLAAFKLIEKQLPEAGKDQIVALIDTGSNVMNFTVLRNGQQLYVREQAFGGGQLTQEIARHYGMGYEEAEAAKRAGNLPEAYEAQLLGPFRENFALEVARALQFFFTSTQYNQAHHLVLAGGCALLPGADKAVAIRTQVNTLIANPFAGMALSDRVRARNLLADSSALMVACGLALRRFDPS